MTAFSAYTVANIISFSRSAILPTPSPRSLRLASSRPSNISPRRQPTGYSCLLSEAFINGYDSYNYYCVDDY